jgi:hypothetical protein
MAATRDKETAEKMLEAYVCWREECLTVWSAYDRWSAASWADAGLAFVAYQAALDRERHAADRYARAVGGAGTGAPSGGVSS